MPRATSRSRRRCSASTATRCARRCSSCGSRGSVDLVSNARRALISVSDKSGVVDFARALAARGFSLLSTGGTAALLEREGIPVTEVSAYTGFPEMLDGRVKTLHPRIHAGLLARGDDAKHRAALAAAGIDAIELLVVNLYPFQATVARAGGTLLDLARKVFAHTAAYDAAVANYLTSLHGGERREFPEMLTLQFRKLQDLRYGENPHQSAAFYRDPEPVPGGLASYRQVQGKELSYNNIADADAAWECVKQFDEPACVIIKHANPCGVALADSPRAAYDKAFATDPVSAFGGILAFNRPLDAATAQAVGKQFAEVIIAPRVETDALQALAPKANLRLLEVPLAREHQAHDYKRIGGGLLVQSSDAKAFERRDLRGATRRQPNDQEWADLLFACRVAKFVKSNALAFFRAGGTPGVGG